MLIEASGTMALAMYSYISPAMLRLFTAQLFIMISSDASLFFLSETNISPFMVARTMRWTSSGLSLIFFIEVPKPPLASVTHIKYYDTAGTLQTWAVANYDVQAPGGPRCARGRIALSHGIAWPSTYGEIGDVQIRFICGYGAAGDVPKLLKDGMLIDLGTLDLQRDGVTGMTSDVDGWTGQIYKSFRSYPTQRLEAA